MLCHHSTSRFLASCSAKACEYKSQAFPESVISYSNHCPQARVSVILIKIASNYLTRQHKLHNQHGIPKLRHRPTPLSQLRSPRLRLLITRSISIIRFRHLQLLRPPPIQTLIQLLGPFSQMRTNPLLLLPHRLLRLNNVPSHQLPFSLVPVIQNLLFRLKNHPQS